MSEVLSLKDLICAYWGLLPTVFIVLIIGMLKLPCIKILWRNQGYDAQPVGNSELRITPEQRVTKINELNKDLHSDKIRYINNHWEQMQFPLVLLDPSRLCPHRNRYIS